MFVKEEVPLLWECYVTAPGIAAASASPLVGIKQIVGKRLMYQELIGKINQPGTETVQQAARQGQDA
jgi:hypothetical protein